VPLQLWTLLWKINISCASVKRIDHCACLRWFLADRGWNFSGLKYWSKKNDSSGSLDPRSRRDRLHNAAQLHRSLKIAHTLGLSWKCLCQEIYYESVLLHNFQSLATTLRNVCISFKCHCCRTFTDVQRYKWF